MTTTTANGITVQDSATQPTHTPRKFAAAVRRNHPAIKRIKADVRHDAKVWLTDNGGEDGDLFCVPDGWEVVETFVTSNGSVALKVNRT